MWNDTEIPLAHLITFRTYGSWLHGDERGSVDRSHRTFGTPYAPASVKRKVVNKARLKGKPVRLNRARRVLVEAAIRETCDLRGWRLRGVNVRTNHVHSVVSVGFTKSEIALNAFKANATRKMRESGCWKYDYSPWVDKGSRRALWNEKNIALAIDYVLNGQGGEPPDFL